MPKIEKNKGSELLEDIRVCGIDHVIKAARTDFQRAFDTRCITSEEIKNAQERHEIEKPIAYNNFVKITANFFERLEKIKENGITCGECAAFPCFRTPSKAYATEPSGGCYQEERQCRQECHDFTRNEGSGAFPEYKITGICRKNNKEVDYCSPCMYIESDRKSNKNKI